MIKNRKDPTPNLYLHKSFDTLIPLYIYPGFYPIADSIYNAVPLNLKFFNILEYYKINLGRTLISNDQYLSHIYNRCNTNNYDKVLYRLRQRNPGELEIFYKEFKNDILFFFFSGSFIGFKNTYNNYETNKQLRYDENLVDLQFLFLGFRRTDMDGNVISIELHIEEDFFFKRSAKTFISHLMKQFTNQYINPKIVITSKVDFSFIRQKKKFDPFFLNNKGITSAIVIEEFNKQIEYELQQEQTIGT